MVINPLSQLTIGQTVTKGIVAKSSTHKMDINKIYINLFSGYKDDKKLILRENEYVKV